MSTIKFGADKNGSIYFSNTFEKPLDLTAEEITSIDMIYKMLSELETESADIHPERRSTNYLSIVAFSNYDFIRLKIGERAKWFSVFLSPADRSDLENDARFSKVPNKKQIHWKVSLSRIEQLNEHADLVKRAFLSARWSYEKTLSKG